MLDLGGVMLGVGLVLLSVVAGRCDGNNDGCEAVFSDSAVSKQPV